MPRPTRAAHPIGTAAALLLLPASFALLTLIGALTLDWGLPGMAITQVAGFGLPAWLFARRAGPPRAVLGLVQPSGRALAGTLLVGASYWYLSAALLLPLVQDLVTERDLRELAERFGGSQPIALKLLALAALPAVCEEVLFRGAIARGLHGRLGLIGAALLSSAYFALLHGSLARLPITFALGVVLAVVTLRVGSVVPAIVIHAANNAAALAGLQERVGPSAEVVLPLAALATGIGLLLLWRSAGDRTSLVSDATSL